MKKKILPILFATLLIDMIGVGMIFPIIPIIFTDPTSPSFLLHGYSQGMQYFIAGMTTALFGFMQFIAGAFFVLIAWSVLYLRKELIASSI